MTRTKFAALGLLAAAIVACAVNPVTGKKELMLYSESQEIELGKQTDAEVAATYGVYDDAGPPVLHRQAGPVPGRQGAETRAALALHGPRQPGRQRLRRAGRRGLRHPRHPGPDELGGGAGRGARPRDRPRQRPPLHEPDEQTADGPDRSRRRQRRQQGVRQVRRAGRHRPPGALPEVQPRQREPGRRPRRGLFAGRRLQSGRHGRHLHGPGEDGRPLGRPLAPRLPLDASPDAGPHRPRPVPAAARGRVARPPARSLSPDRRERRLRRGPAPGLCRERVLLSPRPPLPVRRPLGLDGREHAQPGRSGGRRQDRRRHPAGRPVDRQRRGVPQEAGRGYHPIGRQAARREPDDGQRPGLLRADLHDPPGERGRRPDEASPV